MAGFTDKAMRQICQELGADITWSEMVSAEGIFRNESKDNKSLVLAEKFSDQEKNYWVQIFGNNPLSMGESAKMVQQKIKPLGIDINLGCPVKKAQKAGYGAVQMGKMDEVVEIIKIIKKSSQLPLSLKTRLGLRNPEEILDFAPRLEKAGINQLVVHARTFPGMFHAKPDWKIVRKLKTILTIPIIYNGGIKTPEDAKFYFEKTGCSILMIGQAAIGNPWIFREIKDFFENEKFTLPTLAEKKEIILKHAKLVKKYYSERGFVTFRPQLAAYLKGHPDAANLRHQAVRINSLDDVKEILKEM
ncbi:MAG: tRNA-dihydrouridine synthase [Candidatus Moranbacteria bacterium GW2011_GWF1_34_10]|nr:MAG: tRNA-dihydrouridine synthase [Candidatus Moranbacteria bacterium GW2011_GWF1_34_10]